MIAFDMSNGIARLQLCRPERCNALNAAMLAQLDAALQQVEASEDARVLLIQAEGEQFFSSGADIDDWGGLAPHAIALEWIRRGNRLFQRLAELPVPVVCGIRGRAYGGGAELALAADIRIVTPDVQFGFPETAIGAIPGWMGCARLAESLGVAHARSLVLSGELINAEKMLACGLVSEIVPTQDLERTLDAWCERLRGRSKSAMSTAKQVFSTLSESSRFAAVHELAASVCRVSADGQEGIDAFHAKRAPQFR